MNNAAAGRFKADLPAPGLPAMVTKFPEVARQVFIKRGKTIKSVIPISGVGGVIQ
jgi:hypothetical protein